MKEIYDIELKNEDVHLKLSKLRKNLRDTDYVVLKIAEGEATKEEYAAILSDRKIWRAEINALEKTNG